MTSPVSSTVNINKAFKQLEENTSGAPPVVSAMYPTIIKEWPINATIRSVYVLGSADGPDVSGGTAGGACWFDCSLSASATGVALRILVKLGGTGASGPFG
jgi:hypothetical protein